MLNLPSGTVTFVFTDIEGSTRLWEEHPSAMHAALARHDAIMRTAIEGNGGVVFRTEGDAFRAAFPSAATALEAAIEAQRALAGEAWGETGPLRVRMALHAGTPLIRDGEYHGPHLNRIARLLATGHGGQTLLSHAAYELVYDALPGGVSLKDLGEHSLKDLNRSEHIYQVDAPGLPSEFPPLRSLDSRPNNLPAEPTPFVGREEEVRRAVETLSRPEVRLLTMTGPGGTGKTRLSLQVGFALLDTVRDGVFFVACAAITDPAFVLPAVAQAIGVSESGGRPVSDSLKTYLRDKEVLLILDNLEQVTGAGPIIAGLVEGAPRVKALVTSRAVLHVYGENELPVPPLSLPDPKRLPPPERLMGYDSVRLFVERARAAKPDFRLTLENAPFVAEICYRLDGLPLAIELAAARIKLLPPQAMLARLQSRLKLLTGGSNNLPARQQTLRGAIEWGYDLLTEQEKRLFNRLGVFVGGFGFEAAERVATGGDEGLEPLEIDVLDGLGSLVDKSLIRQMEDETGEPRFTMLETLREYAHERLETSGELPEIRRRHAEYYAGFAEAGGRGTQGPEQREWLLRLDNEIDNFRASIRWCIEQKQAGNNEGLTAGYRTIGPLWQFWQITGHLREGHMWSEEILAGTTGRSYERVRALFSAGYVTFIMGDSDAARPVFEEGIAIAGEIGDDVGRAYALCMVGAIIGVGGDLERGREISQNGVALFRKAGTDKWGLCMGLVASGTVLVLQGDYALARSQWQEAGEIARALGDKIMLGQTLNYLGDLARVECEYEQAKRLYNEVLGIFREQGNKSDYPALLHNLAYTEMALGRFEEAHRLLYESLKLHQELDNKQGIAECLAGFAAVAAWRKEPERAARLFGASEKIRLSVGAWMWPVEQIEVERNTNAARSQMDDGAWLAAWGEGAAMTLDEAVAYALAVVPAQEAA